MNKRIIILSAFLSPFRSGAEACVEEVSKRLKDDFDITIITARLRKDLPKEDMVNGVKVRRIGLGYSFDKWLYPFLAPLASSVQRPESIHAILETFAGLALVLSKLTSPSAKKILTLQTTNTTFLKSFIIRSADTVTAISSPLVQRAKIAGKKAVHIPNGIDLKAYEQARSAHQKVPGRILYVGRLEPMKGVDTVLVAFGELLNAHAAAHIGDNDVSQHTELRASSFELRIVGDGSEKSKLESLAKELGIDDLVTFAGRVEPSAIPTEFAQAEIFCGLSRSEALGNVFIEAQAAGCAVIGTSIGGIPDIVCDHKTGLLVPPNNPEAAKDAMLLLCGNKDLQGKLAEAGVQNAASYNWDTIALQYKALYE